MYTCMSQTRERDNRGGKFQRNQKKKSGPEDQVSLPKKEKNDNFQNTEDKRRRDGVSTGARKYHIL